MHNVAAFDIWKRYCRLLGYRNLPIGNLTIEEFIAGISDEEKTLFINYVDEMIKTVTVYGLHQSKLKTCM
jgi:hypothetical protein